MIISGKNGTFNLEIFVTAKRLILLFASSQAQGPKIQEKAGIPGLGHQLSLPFDEQPLRFVDDLETAAKTTVVVDSECTD